MLKKDLIFLRIHRLPFVSLKIPSEKNIYVQTLKLLFLLQRYEPFTEASGMV